jgi:hypothetical protein
MLARPWITAVGLAICLSACSGAYETLDVEMAAIPENPDDPGWRLLFQAAADAKCNGSALVSDEPLRFTSRINGRPPVMSGLYKCK